MMENVMAQLKMTDVRNSKKMFFHLLRIRRIEERIVDLYPQQKMRCPVHLCIGQEAVAVGVCQTLHDEDLVLSNHRAHGHYLAKGGDLKAFFAELYGKETGCSKGRGGSMHLIDLKVNFLGSTPIVGSCIPVATGVALAEMNKKKSTVTVIFLGEAACEEGAFHECLNFAALKKLPLLFVCENNGYSVYTPLKERQPPRPIYHIPKAHGIESLQGDGNDVLGVYQMTQKALEHIRLGRGPAFLEFMTYRWREHCGPNYDNDLGYRSVEDFERWKKKCPVETFRQMLCDQSMLNEREIQQMEDAIQKEITEAVSFTERSRFPQDVTQGHVYAS
jgi:pyruvate dehydrogenase E1 component alpha subunit